MPVLNNLIESAGNFEVALDLIQNASDMIEKELRNAKICNTFKEQLETYKFKCTQKLESECLNIVDQWVNSKIQFIPSTERSEEFKLKFTETIETYFEGNTAEICDFKLIMDKWTINFESDDDVFF